MLGRVIAYQYDGRLQDELRCGGKRLISSKQPALHVMTTCRSIDCLYLPSDLRRGSCMSRIAASFSFNQLVRFHILQRAVVPIAVLTSLRKNASCTEVVDLCI